MSKEIYHKLDAEKVIVTIETLHRRITERFPDSGLGKACMRLLEMGKQADERSKAIAKPNIWLRVGIYFLILMIVFAVIVTFSSLHFTIEKISVTAFVQILESGLNDVILIGAGIFFLVTLETRIKRKRALNAIHDIRVIAHIIDMHQLTKDPEQMLKHGSETASSPKRQMTRFELSRYLDYCSEMLSIAGNIAALYIQNFDDSVAIASAGEVETLTNSISRKIWQKLMILQLTDRSAGEDMEKMKKKVVSEK